MKSLVISLLLAILPISAVATEKNDSASVTMSKYDRRIHRHREHWAALIPTQVIMQYAGNMGFMSVGVGWDYGKHDQWETHLLFGYLPKADSDRGKLTMTLKQTFLPWSFSFGKGSMQCDDG